LDLELEMLVSAVIRLKSMRIVWIRKSVSILLALVLIAAGLSGFRHFTRPKPWSDDRMIEGVIYSVATGTITGGREIVVAGGFVHDPGKGLNRVVCCYDAATGRIFWENSQGGYADLPGLQMNVAIDGNGDIFVTSHKRFSDQNTVATLEKLKGPDGCRIWEKEFSVSDWLTGNRIIPPSLDHSGNIWLIESIVEGDSRLSRLRLLSGESGSVIAIRELTQSKGVYLSPETVCLKRGGALLFIFRDTGEQQVFRFSTAGEVLQCFPLVFSTGGTGTLNLRRYVDEERCRVLISEELWQHGYSSWGTSIVQTAAFSMESGEKLWETSNSLPGRWGHSEGYLPELAFLKSDGDLEYRHEALVIDTKIDWHRWKMVKGIPLPERVSEEWKRLERSLVSAADGSIGNAASVTSWENWFEAQEREAGTSTKEIYTNGQSLHGSGRFRCRDARRWLPASPSKQTGVRRQCFRVVRTPSGRLILSRDPNDRNFVPQVRNWQIRALKD
jgi:hypothetical protein